MNRSALTLLEIILAMTISAIFAVAAVTFVRGDGDTAHAASCRATRVALISDAEIFEVENGQAPDASFDRLIRAGLIEESSRTCPSSSQRLRWSRGQVLCPVHGVD